MALMVLPVMPMVEGVLMMADNENDDDRTTPFLNPQPEN